MPDQTKDEKKNPENLNIEFQQIFRTAEIDASRSLLETTWYRNILYMIGEQWLSWFTENRAFGRRYELSSEMPTPVSNMVRDTVNSLKALTLNKRYTTRIWPNSSELEDKDAAWLGEQLIINMDLAHDGESSDILEWIELMRLLTGNGFGRVYADTDTGEFVIGPDGKPVVSKGEVRTSVVLPFNIYVPTSGLLLEDKRYLGITSIKDREWVEDIFQVKVDQSETDRRLVDYEQQLNQLVANVSPWKGRGPTDMVIEDMDTKKLVVYKEVQYRPSMTFPKGRHVVMIGRQVIKDEDDLPIPTDENGHWSYDVTHFPYSFTPGGFWATSAVDDLISPQNNINEIDQALAINRQSIGRPFVLTPSDLVLRRISNRSQALLAVQYDSRKVLGAKPQIHPGTPYPQQILEERAINKTVAQDVAGDPKNILRGQSPHSGASGIMVDILREAAEASHGPDVARFYRNKQKMDRKRLILAQTLYTEKRYLKIAGQGNEVYIKAFRGSDLRSNTDVRLELDSASSTTHAGKNELLTRLITGRFFGDISLKPRLQRYVLQNLGLNNVPDEENLHRDKAEWENSVLANGSKEDLLKISYPSAAITDEQGQPMQNPDGTPVRLFPPSYDPTFRHDNHAVHVQVLQQLLFSRQFRALPQERQQLAIAHYDMHAEALKAIEEERNAKVAEQVQQGVMKQGGGPLEPPQTDIPTAGGQPPMSRGPEAPTQGGMY